MGTNDDDHKEKVWMPKFYGNSSPGTMEGRLNDNEDLKDAPQRAQYMSKWLKSRTAMLKASDSYTDGFNVTEPQNPTIEQLMQGADR